MTQSMATKLDVEKRDILDRNADSMALGLALSETHIINETKKYLEEVCTLLFLCLLDRLGRA